MNQCRTGTSPSPRGTGGIREASGRLTKDVKKTYVDVGKRLLLPNLGKMALSDINQHLIPRWIPW
jgi:hypothetical protein